MPFMNHLPRLAVMFIHAVCNLLYRTKKNACCHASGLKKKHFHFSILVACECHNTAVCRHGRVFYPSIVSVHLLL